MNMKEAIEKMEPFRGWFFRDEAAMMYKAAKDVTKRLAGSVVEVGSYCGRSTTILAAAVEESRGLRAKVCAIDPHLGDLSRGKEAPTWDVFLNNMEKAGVSEIVLPIRKRSVDVEWWMPIAFILIDGLHDYDSVKADFEHFYPFVELGGLVAFHDYWNEDHPDVKRFVDEQFRARRLDVEATLPNPSKEGSLVITRKI